MLVGQILSLRHLAHEFLAIIHRRDLPRFDGKANAARTADQSACKLAA